MEIAKIPPLRMVRGQPFSQVWQFKADGVPVDLSDWTGRCTFTGSAPLDLLVETFFDGRVLLDLTAEHVNALRGAGITFTINLDAPLPILNEVWQGSVHVAEA